MKLFTLIIFILSYLLFLSLPRYKVFISWAAVLILLITKIIGFSDVFHFINWDVLGILIGMFYIADVFNRSQAPAYLGIKLLNKTKNTAVALLSLCILTGFISSFMENVATFVLLAPIAINICQRLKITPLPVLVGMSISSNLEGSATLIGDPPSIILGGFSGMDFLDFFWFKGKASLFFAVQIGFLFALLFLYFVFRQFKKEKEEIPLIKVKSWIPSYILLGLIICLSSADFFPFPLNNIGVICIIFGVISLIYGKRNNLINKHKEIFDWEIVLFIAAIFILTGTINKVGLIKDLSLWLENLFRDNVFITYWGIIGISVFASAFIDNVPYVTMMLPVCKYLAENMAVSPYLFYFGLLLAATVGGNITPVGSATSIVAWGRIKKEGYAVKTWDFVKIGLPFTILAVGASCWFIWLLWK